MENRFIIYRYSKLRFFFFSFLPIMFTGILDAVLIIKFGVLIGGIISIFLLILTLLNWFVGAKYTSKAVIKITIADNKLFISPVKPFLWSKKKDGFFIRLEDIKAYKYEPSSNFSVFEIELNSKNKYKISRWYNDDDDEFNIFLRCFKKTVKAFNEKKDSSILIIEEKLIMGNRLFLYILSFVLGIIIIGAMYLSITKGIQNPRGLLYILIVLPLLIWLFQKIVLGLRVK